MHDHRPSRRRTRLALAGLLAVGAAGASPAAADPALATEGATAASGTAPPRALTILEAFPDQPDAVRDDVRAWLPQIRARHGEEEWKAAVLTHEFHHHLGIWSLVGAKMGVRAREVLGADVDDVRVESRAGTEPPLSCLNDGLQAGSGATLGRGSFALAAGAPPRPAARFRAGDRAVELALDPEVGARIRRDVAALAAEHGDLTPAYFSAVRELSLRYWAELDRDQIFQVREVAPEATPRG